MFYRPPHTASASGVVRHRLQPAQSLLQLTARIPVPLVETELVPKALGRAMRGPQLLDGAAMFARALRRSKLRSHRCEGEDEVLEKLVSWATGQEHALMPRRRCRPTKTMLMLCSLYSLAIFDLCCCLLL